MRNVYACIEQPLNSILFYYPDMKMTLDTHGGRRCVTHAGYFGAPSRKPLEVFTAWPVEIFNKYCAANQRDADLKLKDVLDRGVAKRRRLNGGRVTED
eukprot:1866140-Pyramimonas_sp.AAC.1